MNVLAFPSPAPFGTQADQPLRVLRPDLSERVAKVSRVLRVLTDLDVRVESQDLIRNGNRPLLRLFRGDARLRHFAESVRQVGAHITAVIGGVDVQWPAHTTPFLNTTSTH